MPGSEWVRSKSCSGGQCVEVSRARERVRLRDGKLGAASPVIEFSAADWQAFLELAPKVG